MTSKAEAITQAVVSALTVPPMTSVPAARVYRDLHGAMQADDLPAIAVETGDEDTPDRRTTRHKLRWLDLQVTVVARGASPYTAGDAALVEAFGRVFADRSLGGLAMEVLEGPTRRERSPAEQQVGAVTKTYRIQYTTLEESLE